MTLPFGVPVGDTSSYNAPRYILVQPQLVAPLVLAPGARERCYYLPLTAQVPFVAANNYPQTVQPPQERGFEDLVSQRARADLAAAFARGGRGQA